MGLFKNKQDSKEIAKKRLKNLISNEKNNMTKDRLDVIKSDILHVVEDYLPIDRQMSDIYITDENKESAIVVILPIAKEKQ